MIIFNFLLLRFGFFFHFEFNDHNDQSVRNDITSI